MNNTEAAENFREVEGFAVMTPAEAAAFLRVSKSTLYQRKDIPRYRMPGSRALRFFRSDLLAWLKGEPNDLKKREVAVDSNSDGSLALGPEPVYHRLAQYR
jgi:excisionase family DNA binding protein